MSKSKNELICDEDMEEEPMEMEIDETVPNTPIIETTNRKTDFTLFTPIATISTPTTIPIDDDIEIINVETLNKTNENQSIVDDDDIVILDDDNDQVAEIPVVTKRRSINRKMLNSIINEPVEECDIIDLVENKNGSANGKCINYACKSGICMMVAPLFCLSFYRVKSADNKKREVCYQCFDIAMMHFDKLGIALQQGKLLSDCDIPIRNDLVEIDDSDSEEETENNITNFYSSSELEYLNKELESVIKFTINVYNINEQCNKSIQSLKKRGELLTASHQYVDTMLHDTRKTLDTIHNRLYSEFKVHYKELPSLDIPDSYPATQSVPRSTPTFVQREKESDKRNLRKSKSKPHVELQEDLDNSSNTSPTVDKSKNTDGAEATEIATVPTDLPPKGPLHKPPLQRNEVYYAVRFNTMGSWIRVHLTDIVQPGTIVNGQTVHQRMYYVALESRQQNKRPLIKLISGKQLAYTFPSAVQLDVGARVIAVFQETSTIGECKKSKKEVFYPGIVAEPMSFSNNFRYLIFFDDGYAQYVSHKMVNLICESSKNVWEDMHIDSRTFIKKYLESYPERPMVKLSRDQTVRTEYNGKWCLATVMNIDCSLVQMSFEASNRMEWIYRGSTRLIPMFKEEQALTNRPNNTIRSTRKSKALEPYVQYTRNEPDVETESEPMRAVARKSTAKSTNLSEPTPPPVPFLPINNKMTTKHQLPPLSKLVYFTPREQVNTKTVYKSHKCSIDCQRFETYKVHKLKGYNPLSKPILCGWNRITYKYRGKREVNYKTPCGKLLRNMSELHKYLRITKSQMTVDLFDFSFWVHCLAEFVLECNSTINKDLSNGLEMVGIPVVNYVDNEINTFTNYSTRRQPMEGVDINLDSEFLVGCDCEDDCEDKTKCNCWKLTLEGMRCINKNLPIDKIGYVYRRLPEAVCTGIYECNSSCKCASTCLNRVVQNPLKLKLQVFKTENRGWGIRCLNDIPLGTFICIYAGAILTEQDANANGKNFGDEYFAELDYIEVCEKTKEDYEEEAYCSDENDKEDSKNRPESADEEEKFQVHYGSKKKGIDDTDFVPPVFVPKTKPDATIYKSRLRKRTLDDLEKKDHQKQDNRDKEEEEEETVIVSDDEDAFREPSSFNPKENLNLNDSRQAKYMSVRELFAKDECVYIMDARVAGNIGRYLNHSCTPNVFVQNVFVDTHDLRFPWVAFFALTYIRAGTELTWNYNYDVGSVPGKVLYCHCSSAECRGRLL